MRKMLLAIVGLSAMLAGPLAAADDPVLAAVRQAETKLDARVGYAAVDLGTGQVQGYRGDERFPMLSTFKVLVAARSLHAWMHAKNGWTGVCIMRSPIWSPTLLSPKSTWLRA